MDIVIDKVEVNCRAVNHPRPTDLCRETEMFVRGKVFPVMEEILNELNSESSHIMLESAGLDIDLGSVGASMESISVASLKSLLEKQILSNVIEKASHVPAGEAAWRQFVFIVKNGYTPWGFTFKSQAAFEQNLITNIAQLKNGSLFVTQLKEIFKDPDFVYRIGNVFSIEFIAKMLIAVYAELAYTDDQLLSDIDKIASATGANEGFKKRYLLLFLTVYSFAESDIEKLSGVSFEMKERFRSAVNIKRSGLDQIPQLTIGALETTLQRLLGPIATAKKYAGKKKGEDTTPENLREKKNKENRDRHFKDESFDNGDNQLDKDYRQNDTISKTGNQKGKEDLRNERIEKPWRQDGVFVQNAGLVLLANFLPYFFGQLGLYRENTLTDPDKCVYLLQMLCGVEEEEYNLVLNKILCGLEPEANLKRQKKFRKKDMAEGKRLLDSVITHWAALKNTRPETLKNVFLRREGKLYVEDDRVLLRVNKRTEDVLLDYLPWSFSLIKLLWMKYPLVVKWNE